MSKRHGLVMRGGLTLALLLTAGLMAVQLSHPAPVRAAHQPGIYRGTHAGGGAVIFQAGPQGILTFAATDIQGVNCLASEQAVRYGGTGLPITNDAFEDREEFSITPRGRFVSDSRAEGTFMLFPSPDSTCRTAAPVAWTAEFAGTAPATRTAVPTRTRTPASTRTPAPPAGGRTALYLGEADGGAPVQVVAVTNDAAFFLRSVRIGALPPAAPTLIASSACGPRDFTLTGAEGLFPVQDNRVEVRTPGSTDTGDGYDVVITGRYGANGFTGTVAWEFAGRPECSTAPLNWSAALVQGTGDPIIPDTEPAAPAPSRTPGPSSSPVTKTVR